MNIAVVIPMYKVKKHILQLINKIGDRVAHIICVDDACPENTGEYLSANITDHRVVLLRHKHNQGVGGAVLTGYDKALELGADIIVKLDGDGQMDPSYIPKITSLIADGRADYVKGNRFYSIEKIRPMPFIRKIGNIALSFITKLSTGYWQVFDANNGYTAIHAKVLRELPFNKIARSYFFESDMLFRLNTIRAVVLDFPMTAVYEDEASNLSVIKTLFQFPVLHLNNFIKRIIYNYFLRNFSVASIELFFGFVLLMFGMLFGSSRWLLSIESGVTASAGVVMLSALPIVIGFQLLLAFFANDINNKASIALHKLL